MSLVTYAKLLQDIIDAAKTLPTRGELNVTDLRIALSGEESNLTDWLDAWFGFVGDAKTETVNMTFHISAIRSDRWVRQIADVADSEQFDSLGDLRQNTAYRRTQLTDQLTADYFPETGIAWVTNREDNQVVMVFSSRTPLPMSELRLGMIDIITRYLESQNWQIFLGSAVAWHGDVLMLLGPIGCGKTSLLAHLMRLGASIVSDHRFYARLDGDQIAIRAFPQTVTLGLGTALQFEALQALIHRPDRLNYWQKFFDPGRVWSTPPENMAELPDLLKMHASELTEALNAPPPVASGTASGMIVPSWDANQQMPHAEPIPPGTNFETIMCSHVSAENDSIYPRWLPLAKEVPTGDAAPIAKAAANIPAWHLKFHTNNSASDQAWLEFLSVIATRKG